MVIGENTTKQLRRFLLLCGLLAAWLCFAQVQGSPIVLLPCLAAFFVLVGRAAVQGYELPVLMFFLPWSELLRQSPDRISCYTLALLLVCLIRVGQTRFQFQRYYVGITLLLAVTTLLAKILSGYSIDKSYLMLMAMLALFPLMDFFDTKYSFRWLCLFFSAGIVIAALSAQALADAPNIGRFIRVDSYLTVTRRCGYSRDPNFYAAQITAALAGNAVAVITQPKARRIVLPILLSGLLVYCGFLSGSKSFALILLLLAILAPVDLLCSGGSFLRKMALVGLILCFGVLIARSPLFRDKIDVILTRLSWGRDVSGLTTGRLELWKNYLAQMAGNFRLLLIGQGFTKVITGPLATHNTVLQLVYQFGLIGSGLLIAWFGGLCQDIAGRGLRPAALNTLILLTGTLLPWMAIDALFFNELFLIPTFLLIGMRETHTR